MSGKKSLRGIPEKVRESVRIRQASPTQWVATFLCPVTGKQSVSAGRKSELGSKIKNYLANVSSAAQDSALAAES